MQEKIDNKSGSELLQQAITPEKLEELLINYHDYQEQHSKMKGFGLSVIAAVFITKWLFLSSSTKAVFLIICTALLVGVIYKSYLLYKSWASVCKPIDKIAKEENVSPKALRNHFNQFAVGRFGGNGI